MESLILPSPQDDVDNLKRHLGMPKLGYQDISASLALDKAVQRWPLLSELSVVAHLNSALESVSLENASGRGQQASGMKQLVLRGLRGGIGATSLLAGLGIALHEQGERVLLIDLSPDNMLRLHFSVDVAYASGWRARSWMLHHGMRVPWNCSGLHLLPYGELGGAEISQIEGQLCADSSCWAQRCDLIGHNYDCAVRPAAAATGPSRRCVGSESGRRADRSGYTRSGCHVLLQQRPRPDADLLLINRFNPASQLQRDLLLLWRSQPRSNRQPQLIHEDEALPEALAHKLPIGHYAPKSQAASDLRSPALWCPPSERSADMPNPLSYYQYIRYRRGASPIAALSWLIAYMTAGCCCAWMLPLAVGHGRAPQAVSARRGQRPTAGDPLRIVIQSIWLLVARAPVRAGALAGRSTPLDGSDCAASRSSCPGRRACGTGGHSTCPACAMPKRASEKPSAGFPAYRDPSATRSTSPSARWPYCLAFSVSPNRSAIPRRSPSCSCSGARPAGPARSRRFAVLMLIVLSAIISCRYLWWRYTATLHWDSYFDGVRHHPAGGGDLLLDRPDPRLHSDLLAAGSQTRPAAGRQQQLAVGRPFHPDL